MSRHSHQATADETRLRLLSRKKVNSLKIRHDKSGIDEYLTLSLGVSSIIPTQDATAIDLIKAADQALYECKEKGRNRTVFKSI